MASSLAGIQSPAMISYVKSATQMFRVKVELEGGGETTLMRNGCGHNGHQGIIAPLNDCARVSS